MTRHHCPECGCTSTLFADEELWVCDDHECAYIFDSEEE